MSSLPMPDQIVADHGLFVEGPDELFWPKSNEEDALAAMFAMSAARWGEPIAVGASYDEELLHRVHIAFKHGHHITGPTVDAVLGAFHRNPEFRTKYHYVASSFTEDQLTPRPAQKSTFGRDTTIVPLNAAQKDALLMSPDDELRVRPMVLHLGSSRRMLYGSQGGGGAPGAPSGGGGAQIEPDIEQEYLLRCLMTGWSPTYKRVYPVSRPWGLEQAGPNALVLFYYSAKGTGEFIAGAINFDNGSQWLNHNFDFYHGADIASAAGIVKFAKQWIAPVKKATAEQKRALSELVGDLARSRHIWAHFFYPCLVDTSGKL